MRRTLFFLFCAICVLHPPGTATARVNPLKVITEDLRRSEIVIVLDTSGSMRSHPSPSYSVGSDCGGDMAGWTDLCGDGMCTGSEGSSTNMCITDCHLVSNPAAPAGNPRTCRPSYPYVARMWLTKRVLRNLLPDLATVGSFGLVTFQQQGYFRYFRANTAGTTEKVSIFLTQREMHALGAWSTVTAGPANTFVRNGVTYTLLSQASMIVDKDSLYTRIDNSAEENRFKYSTAGNLYSDGLHTWRYVGSYYTYTQYPINTGTYVTETTYKGPQYVDASGNTWVHNRFHTTSSNYISGSSAGQVVVPLTAGSAQSAYDQSMFQVLARLNMASNGGLWASGGTPTAAALSTAWTHFRARYNGSTPYTTADPLRACRPRYVLLLTDGYHSGTHPANTARSMYNDTTFGDYPINTVVVGLPGLPSSALNALDRVADGGDDGVFNASASAKFANNEAQLLRVVKEALFEMVRGDFTTTASGTTSSGTSTIAGDMALVPSVEYPGWRGHLRAMDMTVIPPNELWDAGRELNSMLYKNRRIFTGYPNSNSGIPVPLMASDGTVNWDGSCCGGVGVKHVWADVEPALDMTNARVRNTIISTVEWLVGKGRPWRLGPLMRSTPATIGPPPRYRNVGSHSVFEKIHAARETLIYVTSNDGILHTFRAKDGTEAFGYVPPNLWPQIRNLYQEGGHATNPENFNWILASSPRIEDIPPIAPPNGFQTQLVQTMGPGAKAWVSLNISNPSVCTVTSCLINDPPFHILQHSRDWGMTTVMGETWSVPTLFYGYAGGGTSLGNPLGRMGMGGGYGSALQGQYYNYFHRLWQTSQRRAKQHSSGGAQVDFTVLADTAAAVNFEQGRRIIATYQPDLRGRIERYNLGDSNSRVRVLNAGSSYPIYYAPALYHLGANNVLFTAVTHAQDEETPVTGVESRIYIRSESGGTVHATEYNMTCPVSQLCSGTAGCPQTTGSAKSRTCTSAAGCPATFTSSCIAPTSRAVPISPPLVLENRLTSGSDQYEAYYLYYDPPTGVCNSGTSWLLRLATSRTGQTVISAQQYVGIRATGMTVVGGGTDVAITTVGRGRGNTASVQTASGNALSPARGQAPYVEVWREVK